MICGVIEGFYGTPWTHETRLALVDFLAENEANTYVWAAKMEPRHRDAWNEPFTANELDQFAELAVRQPTVDVVVGLTPGSLASVAAVIEKLRPAIRSGCRGIVLSFDDVPALDIAGNHRDLANAVLESLDVPVWLVPTHYAGTTSSPYLHALFEGLHREIEVMWTGANVVNDFISTDDAKSRAISCQGRKPLLWDNTPVNDAIMSEALHLGPYTNRQDTLLDEISGLLLNPMEFALASRATLISALAWARREDPFKVWSNFVNRHGWRELAQATAFPDDRHWPGARPSTEWWQSVADMRPTEIEAACAPWIESARDGALLVLAARELLANSPDQQLLALGKIRLAAKWREWKRRPFLTFGSGPRLRPLLTNDESGKFAYRTGSVIDVTSLVDDEMMRCLK